jgi:hypothetical protein
LIGNWWIDCGWNVFTAWLLLQAGCTVMSDVTLQGGDLLTQNCNILTAVDNCKVTDWEGKLQNMNGKTTSQSNSTHCVTIYIPFTTVPFYSHINSIHAPNGPVGTDQFLRLSLVRLERHNFLQKQMELQIYKQ